MSAERPLTQAGMERIIVAGIGNMFLGDDGFGVAVAQRLAERPPAGVDVQDFGIRGLDLAYALSAHDDPAILVDLAPRGGAPGTVYVLELNAGVAPTQFEPHRMDPANVLRLVAALGGRRAPVYLVGCEPAGQSDQSGLSEPVAAAIDVAIDAVQELVARLRTRAA